MSDGNLLERFGLFVGHLKDYMCSAKNFAARASENWKNWRMQSFLCSGFITDILAEAKKFSLLMQDENVSVIKLLNAAESTKSNEESLLKKDPGQ